MIKSMIAYDIDTETKINILIILLQSILAERSIQWHWRRMEEENKWSKVNHSAMLLFSLNKKYIDPSSLL